MDTQSRRAHEGCCHTHWMKMQTPGAHAKPQKDKTTNIELKKLNPMASVKFMV